MGILRRRSLRRNQSGANDRLTNRLSLSWDTAHSPIARRAARSSSAARICGASSAGRWIDELQRLRRRPVPLQYRHECACGELRPYGGHRQPRDATAADGRSAYETELIRDHSPPNPHRHDLPPDLKYEASPPRRPRKNDALVSFEIRGPLRAPVSLEISGARVVPTAPPTERARHERRIGERPGSNRDVVTLRDRDPRGGR